MYRPDSDVDEFGHAVAISGGTAVVVAEEHGAYVFEAGSGGWTNRAVLTPAGREDFGGYDVSAALVGDRAVIGGPEAEAVYLFERTDDGWTQRHRFQHKTAQIDEFGRSVAFDGDRVVVGNAHDPTTMVPYVGAAYVFAGGTGWTREASLTTGNGDLFGTSVAVDGETVLVGAPFAEYEGDNTGLAYVYELVRGSWRQQAVLAPADPTNLAYEARFGHAVALSGDTAVVGAPEIARGTGRAYVYERRTAGWSQEARLTAPAISDGAEFGRSVALVGGTAVVGAPHAHGTGRAYVFTASDAWSEPLRLTAADPHEGAEFGTGVALSDSTALVGAPAHEATSGAYLFDV